MDMRRAAFLHPAKSLNGKRFSGQKENLFILFAALGSLLAGTPRRGVRTVLQAFPGLRTANVLFTAFVLLAGGWTFKSAAGAPSTSLPNAARIHWQGMKRLADETNAAHFMAIWDLPESQRLEQQTLDKLSQAPWRLLHRTMDTNAAALLRPLLDDVVASESYFQIRPLPGRPSELFFAIRLDDRRATLWQTNLARVLESLTGIRPDPAPKGAYGWSLTKHHAPNLIELTRVGQWTVLGAAQDVNGSLAQLRLGTQRNLPPWTLRNNRDWLETDVNPSELLPTLTTVNFQLSTLNRFYLAVTGAGTNVLTEATADFSGPLALDLEPWNIPTSLIDKQVSSFTVIRGFGPWLASSQTWTNLQIGPPPDQICFWALHDLQMLSYFAVPLPSASNEVTRFTDWVLQKQPHWFATNDLAKFEKSKSFDGLEWRGTPFMWPFLRSITISNQNFVFGGGMPHPATDPLSLISLPAALGHTNLVYHDWEITGLRIDHWLYMGQFARYVSHKPQLPFGSPAVLWLKAVEHKLGASVTDIAQTGPNQLSLNRKSDIGFNAIELHLLADWLESPQFPIGLYTFLAPPPPS